MSTTDEIRRNIEEQRQEYITREERPTQRKDYIAPTITIRTETSNDDANKLPPTPLEINENNPGGLTIHEHTPENKQTNNALPGKDNTATIKKGDEPLDLGHYDDDKIKMSDGDIIDYMMKEWIQAGIAWCLDKTSGLGGAILYNASRTVGKGTNKVVRRTKEFAKSAASSVRDSIDPLNDNMADMLQDHLNTVNELSAAPQPLNNFIRNVATGSIRLEGNTYKYLDKEKQKWIESKYTLDDIPKQQYEFVMATAKETIIADAYQYAYQELPENEKEGYDFKKFKDTYSKVYDLSIKQSQNKTLGIEFPQGSGQYLPDKEQQILNNNQPIKRAIADAFNNFNKPDGRCEQITQLSLEKAKLNSEAKLFAEYYAQYAINNDNIKNPGQRASTRKLSKKQLINLKEESRAYATKMFWQFQQARIDGKEVPSNKKLIELAKNQCENAKTTLTENVIYNQYYNPENVKKADRVNQSPEMTLPETFVGYYKIIDNRASELDVLAKEETALGRSLEGIDKQRSRIGRLRVTVNQATSAQQGTLPIPHPNQGHGSR